MNENLQRVLQNLRTFFTGLSLQKKIALGVTAALTIALIAVGVVVAKHDPYQVVFTDLQGEDSKAIEKKLGELNIPFTLSEDRTSVSVPGSLANSARMQLAKEGIPGNDVVGFEKFDGSTIGMSTYIQRIQYVRAVQGELTRSIQRLVAVKSARVHISIPPKKTFLEEEDPRRHRWCSSSRRVRFQAVPRFAASLTWWPAPWKA